MSFANGASHVSKLKHTTFLARLLGNWVKRIGCSRYIGSSVTAAKVIPRVCYNKSKLIKIFGTPQVLKNKDLYFRGINCGPMSPCDKVFSKEFNCQDFFKNMKIMLICINCWLKWGKWTSEFPEFAKNIFVNIHCQGQKEAKWPKGKAAALPVLQMRSSSLPTLFLPSD